MTQLLEKALIAVYKLPPEKQDAIAAVILEELEDDQRWDEAFAASEDKLAQLAQKVRTDIKAGHVTKMGFDELCNSSGYTLSNQFTRYEWEPVGVLGVYGRVSQSIGFGSALMLNTTDCSMNFERLTSCCSPRRCATVFPLTF